MKKLTLVIVALSFLFVGCKEKVVKVSLTEFSKVSQENLKKISDFEAKQDPTNIDSFMAMGDSATKQRTIADSILVSMYKQVKDTMYLEFKQTKNLERIKILKVWITAINFDEVSIEAQVQAIDNSSFMGPYTSASIYDKDNKRIEVGGGIGGPADKKMVSGETYIFKGKIDNLNKLSNFKSLNFDEDIKKW